MNYVEVKLVPEPMSADACDVLAALLGERGFDSFVTEADGLHAYCPAETFSVQAVDEVLAQLPLPGVSVAYTVAEVPVEDWNAAWESRARFEPIVLGGECVIHAPQATDVPPCEYDIVIEPSMSFGTGHHETTLQLVEEILKIHSLKRGRTVLDMGTGTGVLAILAARRGAGVRAVEIDPRVAENARHNVALNGLEERITVEVGDAGLLADGRKYDLVLANINRNVLLADLPAYARALRPDGVLLMSGFYVDDVALLREKVRRVGLRFGYTVSRNRWAVIRCCKELGSE